MKLYKSLASAEKERDEVQALKITVKDDCFPDQIINFPNLRELYLEGDCSKFPDIVPVWDHLKVLSIKWPKFNGDFSALFKLQSLENLKIIDTPFRTFLLPLGHAAAPLKSLTIKDCGLTQLPEEFAMLWQLSELNLSGNLLSKLPASFIDLSNLKRLNLDGNRFSQFPDEVKKMTALSHISFDNNNFSEEEKERIQREFHIWLN